MQVENFKTIIYIDIAGDCANPDAISDELEIDPYSTSLKGLRKGERQIPSKQNRWSWRTTEAFSNAECQKQFLDIVDMFGSKNELLSKYSKCMDVTITIVVYAIRYYPGIIIVPEFVKFCAESGASIQIESYIDSTVALAQT
jgi:uncharacterized protein DUF4279